MLANVKFLKSESERTTLSQELRVIVEPLADGDTRLRRIQLIVPQAPQVYAKVDPDDADLMTSRPYNTAPIYPGQVIQFWLAPDQRLAAQASEGIALASVLTEFYTAQGA